MFVRRAVLVCVLAAACGGSMQATGNSTTVTVSPPTASVAAGGTVQFLANPVNDGYGHLSGSPATWDTSNHAVATVDQDGKATGVAAGTATVTATIGSASGKAQLTVTAAMGNVVTVQWSLGAQTNTVVTNLHVGDTVQWMNVDATHSVAPDTGTPPPQSEGPSAEGTTYGAQTINTPGTYNYHCTIHPGMHGQLVVQ